jgi:membrane protease YdiL (CAAX protease family)
MKPELHKKPLIPFGWLRALLFLVLCMVAIVLTGTVLKLLQLSTNSQAAKTVTTQGPDYLLIISSALISVIMVWLFRKLVDRRSFESLGFSMDKNGMHAGTGFFLGIFLVCAGTCLLYFSKNLQWTGINFNGTDLFISFGLMLIVAFYEELMLRGYILNNLMESVRKWPALIISALVFALLHAANPDFSAVGAINILLAGLLLGINYIYTKNLWFGILLHFSWNFFQGPLLGFEVSGLQLQSLLQHDIQGSELLTGGKFGFEGSLVATVLLTMVIVILAWVYEKKYAPLLTDISIPEPV